MAFDIGAGFSSAGEAVAKTAGAYTLEAQKGELEMQKVKLADELAGAREEKHRGFLTSERESTQKFTSGESALNRANALEAANIGLKGHLASAGAAVQSARIHAESIEKQIAAENDRSVVMQPNADMTVSRINKVTGKTELVTGADNKPIKVRDPDLARAQYEAVRAVENDKKEIRMKYGPELALAQSELNKLISQPMALQDETLKKPIAAARKLMDEIAARREAELAPHNERSRQLIDSLSRNIDTGAPDLTKYMPQKPAASGSLIDTPMVPGNL